MRRAVDAQSSHIHECASVQYVFQKVLRLLKRIFSIDENTSELLSRPVCDCWRGYSELSKVTFRDTFDVNIFPVSYDVIIFSKTESFSFCAKDEGFIFCKGKRWHMVLEKRICSGEKKLPIIQGVLCIGHNMSLLYRLDKLSSFIWHHFL